jgi:hypothetical protein
MTKRHLIQAMLMLALVRSIRSHKPGVPVPFHRHKRSTMAGRIRQTLRGAERVSGVLTDVPRHLSHQSKRHSTRW